MNGGTKDDMKADAERHFTALKTVLPHVRRVMVFDYDTERTAFHPDPANPVLFEWKRKNIENYLLVPEAWIRAVGNDPSSSNLGELFVEPLRQVVVRFFEGQNLTLPAGRTWNDVSANIFQVVDGKRILFENADSLFHQLRQLQPKLVALRQNVAGAMIESEIHTDVRTLFSKLEAAVNMPPTV
jgi:hypothetical protein